MIASLIDEDNLLFFVYFKLETNNNSLLEYTLILQQSTVTEDI